MTQARKCDLGGEAGAVLVLALLVAALLTALSLGLVMLGGIDRRMSANGQFGAEALGGADAAGEWVLHELALAPDWTAILNGAASSSLVDTRRPVLPGGGTLDLDAVTADVQAQSDAASPLGANTPQWRLFAWGPLSRLLGPGRAARAYIAVWIADDATESDGNALADANGVVAIHVEAYGSAQTRRIVEGAVARRAVAGGRSRVVLLSWREVR